MDLARLIDLAKTTPYASRPGPVPVTEAAWSALARAEVAKGQLVIGGERHGFVAQRDGLLVLAIGEGEDTPTGPIDPDLGDDTPGPIDPDISSNA